MTDPHQHDRPALDLMRETLGNDRQRARFTMLLDLLETPAHADRVGHIEATVGVIAAARDQGTKARLGANSPLSPDDAARVDRWIEGERDERLERLVTLLDVPNDASRDERIASTLATVQSAMDTEHQRFRLDPVEDHLESRRRFRLADLGAIAASLVIIASIAFPAISNFQSNTWASQNTANLQQAGFASALFASDHDARIPHATHRTSKKPSTDTQWWRVGDAEQSHSANLFALISEHYVPVEVLNAPTNSKAPGSLSETGQNDWASTEQVSYSYRLFDPALPPTITALYRSILIADRSPVVRQALASGTIDASVNSDNLKGKGQHVVFGDGSVVFLTSPILPNGDNIWLPRRAERTGTLSLRGDERPASPDDQFVGP